MRAIALTAEGQSAALVELPDPELTGDGLVIRVRAASVNGFDAYQAGGGLMAMMPHDLPTVVGRDLSGVVVDVGADRRDVAAGDAVLGFLSSVPPLRRGTWAELVGGGRDLVVARKPAGLDWISAAAIPLAGATALDSVDAIDPGPGDALLIMGSTGGVGTFAIQLAAQRGARVIASARPGDEDAFVRRLGAAETIDYRQSGLGDTVRRLTPDGLVGLIDLVSSPEAFAPLGTLVRRGGRAATTRGAADVAALAERGVTATNILGTPTSEKLARLADAASAGLLQVPIQQTFPLADFLAAIAAFNAGTLGKLVLTVD
jgi:NADPH:quinone reductase-like Zn-dependent oxidoreductase